jgi:hypothetical protein
MNRLTTLLSIGACALGLLAGGCGSGSTRTVSVASSPPASGTASTPTASTPSHRTSSAPATSGAAATPAPAAGSPSGGTAAPQNGRSSSGPAFLSQGASAQGLDGALAVLHSHGFSALDTGQYRSDQTLKVLVGARQGSADSHVQQAFFFVNGRYLGTDTSQPSAQIHVAGQSDTQVTLAYSLYRSRDPLCCPSGGQAQVRYQLDNGRLTPLDPIPGASASSAAAGRQ